MQSVLIRKIEQFIFAHRLLILTLMVAITAIMGIFAAQLRMDAGFEKQMPIGHEYIKTFEKYKVAAGPRFAEGLVLHHC